MISSVRKVCSVLCALSCVVTRNHPLNFFVLFVGEFKARLNSNPVNLYSLREGTRKVGQLVNTNTVQFFN